MNLSSGARKSSQNLLRNTPPQEKYNFFLRHKHHFTSSLCEESGIKLYSRCFYWTNVSPPKELTRWLVLSWNITQQTDGLVSTPTLYNAKINEVYIYIPAYGAHRLQALQWLYLTGTSVLLPRSVTLNTNCNKQVHSF